MMDLDHCYECRGYGDDYYFDDDGELVSACDDCPFNEDNEDATDDLPGYIVCEYCIRIRNEILNETQMAISWCSKCPYREYIRCLDSNGLGFVKYV